jgi:hypothetical protein
MTTMHNTINSQGTGVGSTVEMDKTPFLNPKDLNTTGGTTNQRAFNRQLKWWIKLDPSTLHHNAKLPLAAPQSKTHAAGFENLKAAKCKPSEKSFTSEGTQSSDRAFNSAGATYTDI